MRLTISSGFVRVCLTAVAVGIAAPAFAGDLPVQVAQTRDDIISGLSAPAAVPAVRGKGDTRGLNVVVQQQDLRPPSMNFNVRFQLGSAALTPEAKGVLDELGSALVSEELSPYNFDIMGHTDATGTETFNQQLSQQRAIAVEDYLATNFGIQRQRLRSMGMGESMLLDNNNPFGASNRRVEIINTGVGG